jgi:hypothetical protein
MIELFCLEHDCDFNINGKCERVDLQARYDASIGSVVLETENYELCYKREK